MAGTRTHGEGAGKFIQAATERMKQKGTLGSFGKATAKKIAAGKKKGGVAKKKAVFAENMKKIAQKNRRGDDMEEKKESMHERMMEKQHPGMEKREMKRSRTHSTKKKVGKGADAY